jgi:hypothetical protein
VRNWSLGVVAVIAGLIAFRAHGSPIVAKSAPRARTAVIVHRSSAAERPPEPSLEIDEPRFVRHVELIAKLIGHPASELADHLGAAAKPGDDFIEWDVADVGIAAGTTYGLATIENGTVTGVTFRGRATDEILRRIKPQLSLQLTMAGGERPSFTITGGE